MAFSLRGSSRPDLNGLREFVRTEDREDAPFFVGRESEIRDVERTCERVMQHVTKGESLKSVTRLLQGAPGAGKTAILSHLQQRWRQQGKAAPVALRIDVEDLDDVEGTVIEIAEAVSADIGSEWRKTTHRQTEGGVRIAGTGIDGLHGHFLAPERASFRTLKKILPPSKWKTPHRSDG